MKKLVKVLALVVDLSLTPVRFVIGVQTLICGCIVYECGFKEAFKDMIKNNIYAMKTGWKPTMEQVFKD